jgi:hypothetical protein
MFLDNGLLKLHNSRSKPESCRLLLCRNLRLYVEQVNINRISKVDLLIRNDVAYSLVSLEQKYISNDDKTQACRHRTSEDLIRTMSVLAVLIYYEKYDINTILNHGLRVTTEIYS